MRLSLSDRAYLSVALSVLLLSMAAADDLPPEDCVCEVNLMRARWKVSDLAALLMVMAMVMVMLFSASFRQDAREAYG